jgi:ACR3 family arsenite efflux pump ArsB
VTANAQQRSVASKMRPPASLQATTTETPDVRKPGWLLIGVLLVLLSPCIDYVIVFARLAGAGRHA